jgi:hypothetical protein
MSQDLRSCPGHAGSQNRVAKSFDQLTGAQVVTTMTAATIHRAPATWFSSARLLASLVRWNS